MVLAVNVPAGRSRLERARGGGRLVVRAARGDGHRVAGRRVQRPHGVPGRLALQGAAGVEVARGDADVLDLAARHGHRDPAARLHVRAAVRRGDRHDRGPVLATVFVPPFDDPCWPVFVDEEPEQAVTSRHRAPHAPVIASPARRLLSRCRPVSDRSLSRTLVLLWYQSVVTGAAATTASPPCGALARQRGCHEPSCPVTGAPGIRSRSTASDVETDETGRRLPFTIMPTRRCGPMPSVQCDEGGKDTDRDCRPRDGITNVVKQGEMRGRRQVKPDQGHPALRRAEPGELPSLGVEGGGDPGQRGLHHRPAGLGRPHGGQRRVLRGRPAALEGGVRGLVDDQLGAVPRVRAGHVGEGGLEADQHAELERAPAGQGRGHHPRPVAGDHVAGRGLADPGQPAQLLAERDVLPERDKPGLGVGGHDPARGPSAPRPWICPPG